TCQFIPWCNPCSRTECTLRACEHPAVRTCDSGNTDCQKLGCEDACKPRVCEKSTPGCNIYECQHACYQICFTEDCINPWSCQPDCECLCDGPCGTKPPHALCEGECNTRLCAINLANPRDHAFQTHMIEGATITCTLRECQSDCELRTDCKGVPKCTRYTCQGACDCQPPSTNAAATTDTAPETTVTTPNATATVETTDGTTSAIDTTVIETTTEDMTTNTTIATTEEDVATTSSPSNTTTIGTGTAAATTTTPAATTTTPTPTTTTPGTTTTPTPTTLYYCPVPPGCIACPFGPAGMGAEWDEVCESEICANPICANFDCTCSGSTGQRPEFIGMPVAESRKSGDKNDEPFLEKCHYAGCAKPAATQELCPGCGYCRDCDWYYFGTVHCTGCQFGSDCIAQAQCNHSSCIKALDGLLIGICVNPETPQRHGPRNDWCGQHAMCIGCCPDPNVDGKFGGRITYKGFSMVKPEDLGVRGCVFSDKVSGVLHESCKSPNDLVTCNVCAGNRVEMCVSCTAVRYGVVICRGCSRHSDCISGLQNGSRTDGWCEECGLCKVVIPPALESCCDKSGVH
ncbi:MAG: hypothetical protein FWG33_04850, partial [Oscillospiraceae bacterium]|nr:hypothetical protein [Oscillospiraceae bacterium]